MTVPPGLRPPPVEQHFDTFATVETLEIREERQDIAVIGPIAAVVVALTICTLVLDHPSARAVAACLAALGLVVAVAILVVGKRPKPGRHVARHAVPRHR